MPAVQSPAPNTDPSGGSLFAWFEAHSDAASKVGFVSCIVIYAAIVACGLVQSGQWGSVQQYASSLVNEVALKAGFEVHKVSVEGQVNMPDSEFVTALGTRNGVSIFAFDTTRARDNLKHNGWVREARVMRLLPSTLVVELEEKQPYALWREGGQIAVIDTTGQVLSLTQPGTFPQLPVVSGPGAAIPSRALIEALRAFPELMRHVHEMERIAGRRWDLILDTGLRAKLPLEKLQQALTDLNAIVTKNPGALNDIAEVDFRVPSQFTVRLKDGSEKGRKKFLSWMSKARMSHEGEM